MHPTHIHFIISAFGNIHYPSSISFHFHQQEMKGNHPIWKNFIKGGNWKFQLRIFLENQLKCIVYSCWLRSGNNTQGGEAEYKYDFHSTLQV